jgi:hypothetical protein
VFKFLLELLVLIIKMKFIFIFFVCKVPSIFSVNTGSQIHVYVGGHAIVQVVVPGFPLLWPRCDPRSDHVGFLMDKVALWQVFSD